MKRSLNLIPAATLRRQALARLTRVLTIALLSTGSLATALATIEWARGVAALEEYKALDAHNAPLVALIEERKKLRDEIDRLQSREQVALRLAREQHSLSALAAVTLAAASAPDEVYLDKITYRGHDPQRAGDTPGGTTVQLSGAGAGSGAVARFAERLRTGGGMRSVSIESTSPLPGGVPGSRRFEIVCRI